MKQLFVNGMLLCCIPLLTVNPAKAQYYFYNDNYYGSSIVIEAGASAGIMNCLTDLGGRRGIGKNFIKDLNWKVTQPDASLYIIAMYKDAVSLRLEVTRGCIKSYDSLLRKTDPDLVQRYGRNLSFRSPITDFQLSFEIHPLFFKQYTEEQAPYWSPYFIGGIGYFLFNPQAALQGSWYDLHPLRLEGQGFSSYPGHKPYQLKQFNIPIGLGIKYEISASFNARMEIAHRILFTDYLDDVSTSYIDPSLFRFYLQPAQAALANQLYNRMRELQPGYIITTGTARGDAKDNDAFFSIQFKLGWVIRRKISRQ